MPVHNSIISNLMIYQDRLQTSFLQLFAHTQNSEWFSIITVTGQHWVCFDYYGRAFALNQSNSFEFMAGQNHARPQVVKTGIFPSLEIWSKNQIF